MNVQSSNKTSEMQSQIQIQFHTIVITLSLKEISEIFKMSKLVIMMIMILHAAPG